MCINISSQDSVKNPKQNWKKCSVEKSSYQNLELKCMLGLEFAEGVHQRHTQVEAESVNRKECQVMSRTDGSLGDKPRSGLKRWDRQKPKLGLSN